MFRYHGFNSKELIFIAAPVFFCGKNAEKIGLRLEPMLVTAKLTIFLAFFDVKMYFFFAFSIYEKRVGTDRRTFDY